MNKVIDILKIKDVQKIGSSSDVKIKYASDIDLQEIIQTNDFFREILAKFQQRFMKAQNNPNVFITDFKCGMFRGQPVRWNKYTIKEGFQNIDGINISFINCLQMKSIIKMDIIALINGVFTEFSNNYYFTFSDGFSTMPGNDTKLSDVFLFQFQQKIKEKKYFKALKRLYSHFKIKKNKKMQQTMIDFFNSNVGKLNYQINNLQIIDAVLNNPFRQPKKSDVIHNLNIIKKNLPLDLEQLIDGILRRPTLQTMKLAIQDVIQQLTEVVNEQTMDFIDKKIDYQKI